MAEYHYEELSPDEMEEMHQQEIDSIGRIEEEIAKGHKTVNQARRDAGLPTYAEALGLVDKYYEMDPEEEDYLFDGTELVEGMLVTFADEGLRVDLSEELSEERRWKARRYNRWFEISRIKIQNNATITFLAEYKDGTKHKFTHSVVYPMLAKKQRSATVGEIIAEQTMEAVERARKMGWEFPSAVGVAQIPNEINSFQVEGQLQIDEVQTDNEGREEFISHHTQGLKHILAEQFRQEREGNWPPEKEKPWMTPEEQARYLADPESPIPGTTNQT